MNDGLEAIVKRAVEETVREYTITESDDGTDVELEQAEETQEHAASNADLTPEEAQQKLVELMKQTELVQFLNDEANKIRQTIARLNLIGVPVSEMEIQRAIDRAQREGRRPSDVFYEYAATLVIENQLIGPPDKRKPNYNQPTGQGAPPFQNYNPSYNFNTPNETPSFEDYLREAYRSFG